MTGEMHSIFDDYVTRPDGTFRIFGLPGPGILAAKAVGSIYRRGVGAYDIPGMARDGSFATYDSASAKREDASSGSTQPKVRSGAEL